MKDIGTVQHPLRASALPSLLRCPLGYVLSMIGNEDVGSPAADTGSAVHMAARAMHKEGLRELAACLAVMREHLPEYPQADLGTAEQHFRLYFADPRNQAAKVILCEEKMLCPFPPPEGDTSPVFIQGTADQVREENGSLIVEDIKTGASAGEGDEMLSYYAVQLMAYQVMASVKLGRDVHRAAIIRTRDYLKTDRNRRPKPGPVFWYASWTLADARRMMEEVRRTVGDIRAGRIRVTPSAENCRWCPGGGISNCLRRKVS